MMTNSWSLTPLGEVLTERREIPTPESIEMGEISIVSKIGFNEGKIELRSEAKTKTGMILIRPGDLVISGINAVKGAIAIYSETEQKPVAATIHYGSYIPNKERVDIYFLWWFLRSTAFRDIVQHYIPGGIKTELKANRLLAVPVPLPSISEQRCIVARIEALAGRVSEAQRLRKEIAGQSEILLRSLLFSREFGNPTLVKMRELVQLKEPDVVVSPDEMYHFAGVYCFGRGVFRGQRKKGSEFAYPKLTRLEFNNFVYPKLMAWEGAFGVVPEDCDSLVVSTEFPVFRLNQEKLLPETMGVYFRNPSIWEILAGGSKGTNVRRRRLNPQVFLEHEFPLPPMQTQLLLRETQKKVNTMQRIQVETQKELDALMPSILDKAFEGKL